MNKVVYLFETIRNPRWLSLPLIGQHISNFFSRTTALKIKTLISNLVCTRCFWNNLLHVKSLARNVPLGVKKCCCFSDHFKIQHGHLGLWLDLTFFTFFSPKTTSFEITKLAINVPLRVLKKCCYFWSDSKSKMAQVTRISRNVSLVDPVSLSCGENFISAVSPHRMNYKFFTSISLSDGGISQRIHLEQITYLIFLKLNLNKEDN